MRQTDLYNFEASLEFPDQPRPHSEILFQKPKQQQPQMSCILFTLPVSIPVTTSYKLLCHINVFVLFCALLTSSSYTYLSSVVSDALYKSLAIHCDFLPETTPQPQGYLEMSGNIFGSDK